MSLKANGTSLGLLILRGMMGLGMAYHGYGKVFGGNIEGFAQGVAKMGLPFPLVMAWLAALSELIGGILIVMGLFTRSAAFMISGTMFVAAFIAHAADPLSAKELALAYLTIAVTLFFTGPGSFSLDNKINQ